MTITLSLPFPPSVNRLWRAVKGRNIKSEPYRIWEHEAVLMAHMAKSIRGYQMIDGPYAIHILADRPDKRRRDIGNLEKPLSDALVTAGIIADDCLAQRITIEWSDAEPTKGSLVKITLEPIT